MENVKSKIAQILAKNKDHTLIANYPSGGKVVKFHIIECGTSDKPYRTVRYGRVDTLPNILREHPTWVSYAWLYHGCAHYLGEVLFLEVE